MDVTTAFLNTEMEEEIFLRKPPGYEVKGQETKVCQLKQSIYNLEDIRTLYWIVD